MDSARRIAKVVLDALLKADSVSITLEGLSGVSSSFFNVIFADLAAELGSDKVRGRVTFEGLGKTQSMIERRSRVAVLGT